MTLYIPKGGVTWRYDFWWRGARHQGTTHQIRRDDAVLVESQLKLRLRQELGGVAAADPARSPRFQDWAEIYYEHIAPRIERPERVAELLRVVLRFWGARPDPQRAPTIKIEAGAPYRDLRLADPVHRPELIDDFEAWMASRGSAAQTRNHYRGVLRRMYHVAMLPRFRRQTGMTVNPFLIGEHDATMERTVTLTPQELRSWIAAAPYHARLAIGIAALAPKLRLQNVLDLQWAEHFDKALTTITVTKHKTATKTHRPLVAPIDEQLRAILKDARRRAPFGSFVVTYRGEPVKSIRRAIMSAAGAAQLPYGRDQIDGITFHTLRHTAATILGELGEGDATRRDLLGHTDVATTQRYTHLSTAATRPTAERLSRALPIADLIIGADDQRNAQ